MISNINERSKEFNKEVKAMNASNKEFKKQANILIKLKMIPKEKNSRNLMMHSKINTKAR